MNAKGLFLVCLLLTAAFPVSGPQVEISSHATFSPAEDATLLHGVPYVWQEMNGFCNWAATTIAMRYAGADINMHDLFALSGIGFSFAYVKYNDTMLMFPGAIYQQIDPVMFACGLYGLNYSIYFGSDIEGVDYQVQYLEQRGINVGLIDSQDEAFDLMRESIDEGYPLLISVDPVWLPASDYDMLRDQGVTGAGHAVVVVGYNDTAGVAWIMDPGVGSFGNNFGFPTDGRGNYTQISYTNLNLAWSNRYYISIRIEPGLEPVQDIPSQLGPYLRDRLLGVGESYAPGSASAYMWQFGEKAFRGMSVDLTADGLETYLSVFDGMKNEVQFKSAVLLFIGLGLEAQMTLQYLSYRCALDSVPKFMADTDLSDFLAAAQRALPHFQALADNATLLYPSNVTASSGLAPTTFRAIAEEFNSTGDLHTALINHNENLSEISAHLLTIAESWKEAGDALAEIWPESPLVSYGPLIVVVLGLGVSVALAAVYVTKRTPSQ
ncbi:MAG: C39 family peptidase [Candidatus Thorarchaeota archaeon]